MESPSIDKFLTDLTKKLRKGCTAHITPEGRLYYLNHDTKISSWVPPVENWDSSSNFGLPFGWEVALGKDGKTYFINHINKTTTYEDPRKGYDEEQPPQPREVELVRDPELGFGFVAGSERPVVVRFVTEGGPSENKLLPGDQILKIDGKDVEKAPRENVIELVRSSKHSITMTVCQPCPNNPVRRSALLTAAKKAKLKDHPSRVRFAEGVVINGAPLYSSSPLDTYIPFMPNVLKVFLENGQTRSFKYDSTTTVQDVLTSLSEKLSIKCLEHFSLVVENGRAARRRTLSLLDPKDFLAKIAARPGAHHLKCLFRLTFVTKDAYDLLQKDSMAFEYLYMQCCNDVVQQRFASEVKYDLALRLAALQIQQHSLSSGLQGKPSIKAIEKECGLDRFVPKSVLETMKKKEIRKLLNHFLKQNQSLCSPGQKQLTAFQAKLHYLKIVGELPSFGAKYFTIKQKESTTDVALLVGPKYGISQISLLRNTLPVTLANIEDVDSLRVTKEDETSYNVEVFLRDPERESLLFTLEDADELVLLLKGYHRLLTGTDLPVQREAEIAWRTEKVPPYASQHTVREAGWNYPPKSSVSSDGLRVVDLAVPPPPYLPLGSKEKNRYSQTYSNDSNEPPDLTTPVDHNMNETYPLVVLSSHYSPSRPMDFPTAESNIDFQSVMSAEMLEEDPEPLNMELFETKNEEVVNRISEMNKIVTDAEIYLSDEQYTRRNEEEEEGSCQGDDMEYLEPGGPLKATDSLLLLTQVDEIEMKVKAKPPEDTTNISIITLDTEVSPSESDNDSTPTDSPLHRGTPSRNSAEYQQQVTRRDSSFGLHSPDMVPGLESNNNQLMDILRKLQDANEVELPFSQTSLYLDPDIIDLTLLPPPATPDEDGADLLSPSSKAPPDSFLDLAHNVDDGANSSLSAVDDGSLLHESPLLIKNSYGDSSCDEDVDHGNPKLLYNEFEEGASSLDSARVVAELDHLCDALSVLQASNLTDNLPHTPPIQAADLSDPYSLLQVSGTPSVSFASTNLAEEALIEALSSDYQDEDDIDKFIARITVPPPPPDASSYLIPGVNHQDDLSAFIIPPPPSSSPIMEVQNEVIARFKQASDDIKKIMSASSGENESPDLEIGQPPRFCTDEERRLWNEENPIKSQMKDFFGNGVTEVENPSDDTSGYNTPRSSLTSYGDAVYTEESESLNTATDAVDYTDQLNSKYNNPLLLNGQGEDIKTKCIQCNFVAPKCGSTSKRSPSNTSCNIFNFKEANTLSSENLAKLSLPQASSHPPISRSLSWNNVMEPIPGSLARRHSTKLPCKPPLPPASPQCLNRARRSSFKEGSCIKKQSGNCGRSFPRAQGKVASLTDGRSSPTARPSLLRRNSFPRIVNGSSPASLSVFSSDGCRESLDFEFYTDFCPSKRSCANGYLPDEELLSENVAGNEVSPISNGLHSDQGSKDQDGLPQYADQEFLFAQRELSSLVAHLSTLETLPRACEREHDMDKFLSSKDALIVEARQFVTSSKLFVKSAMESSDKMLENLSLCMTLLDRMATLSELVVVHMAKVENVPQLLERLRAVAISFSHTVEAARCAVGLDIVNPHMGDLMHRATTLATALTALMRTLRSLHSSTKEEM